MFENLSKKITETCKVVGDKTNQVAESAKLSYKYNEELRVVNDMYTALGKAYYDTWGQDADGIFYDKCRAISEKLASAEAIKAELNAIKGVVICGNCGAEVPIDYDYCGKCGAKLVKPEPPAAEPESFDEEITEEKEEPAEEEPAPAEDTPAGSTFAGAEA